jgi:aspartokinase-like uncharacterized kinase
MFSDKDKMADFKDNVRQLSNKIGLTDANSHWIPIAGKEYNGMHPAIRTRTQPDRAEHLKQFSVGNGASNVVSINVARENRKLKGRE